MSAAGGLDPGHGRRGPAPGELAWLLLRLGATAFGGLARTGPVRRCSP